jgi:hypothetical protein
MNESHHSPPHVLNKRNRNKVVCTRDIMMRGVSAWMNNVKEVQVSNFRKWNKQKVLLL